MKLDDEKRKEIKAANPSVKLTVATVKDAFGVEHDFVFRPIDRVTSDISSKEVSNSPTKAVEIEMTNSLVFGDKNAIASDDIVFHALMRKWSEIQKPVAVTLGEL